MLRLLLAILSLSLCSFYGYTYDVIGVGSAIIDFVGAIDEEHLATLPGKKGDSTLVNWEQFEQIKAILSPKSQLMLTGGCCANTIKGLAGFGQNAAFCSRIGTDSMSSYFANVFKRLGVTTCFISSQKPIQQVTSLVTPDSQRTFYCYLGATVEFEPADLLPEYFHDVKLAYIEAYLLHNPGIVKQSIAYAKEAGAKVAMDLNSMRVINNFKDEIFDLLRNDLDVVFCNQDEIEVLIGLPPKEGCELLSSLCGVAVVTVGEKGCWVGHKGSAFLSPGHKVDVIDTTGAGDLFAAGFLHGYLLGKPLDVCAQWGNWAGSAVVQTMGAEISPEMLNTLKAQMAAE